MKRTTTRDAMLTRALAQSQVAIETGWQAHSIARDLYAKLARVQRERDIATAESAVNADALATAKRATALAERLDADRDVACQRIARLEIEAERLRLKFSAAHRSLRVTRETLDHVCALVEEHVDVPAQTLVRDELARWLATPREANSRSPGEIAREAQADLAALLGPTGGDA